MNETRANLEVRIDAIQKAMENNRKNGKSNGPARRAMVEALVALKAL